MREIAQPAFPGRAAWPAIVAELLAFSAAVDEARGAEQIFDECVVEPSPDGAEAALPKQQGSH